MRTGLMVLTLALMLPVGASAEEAGLDADALEMVNSGVRVLRLDVKGYPAMLNYYESIPVYQSRYRNFNNPLFFSSTRGGDQRQFFRASVFHIPLFRGRDFQHLEMVDGIPVTRQGATRAPGYRRLGLPGGDSGARIGPVHFHEQLPSGSKDAAPAGEKASDGKPADKGPSATKDSGSSPLVRPELPERFRESVRSGLVVREFPGGAYGLFEPVYTYDDALYGRRDGKRYRILYRLDPVYPLEGAPGQRYLIGFAARGGPLRVMPAPEVELDNGMIRFEQASEGATHPDGAVVAFNADHCPDGWTEYEPAYGRFVRGIDKSGEAIDPAGQRKPGDPQDDRTGWHKHQLLSKYDGFYTKGALRSHASHGGRKFEKKQNTEGAGGKETRPTNVALLYCEKQARDASAGSG